MGCESCTKGSNGQPAGCKNNGTCSTGGCSKLAVYDWLGNMDLPGHLAPFGFAEVRFKGTRKEFFRTGSKFTLNPGDAVVVEATTGYDVGIVSAVGELARLQMERKNANRHLNDAKRILRKANAEELQVWREARSQEDIAMYRSRTIAQQLSLDMKISDVEYQGDNTKATFYYTADGRIDFRELIRKLADTFRIRIEMRQIGARQEAARLGGIGSCGRELCCSTWLTDFRSVSTSAARYQQLALNTQKLAGQCGKLKCCLNYELDAYMDALKDFPKNYQKLKTQRGTALHMKTDIFKGMLWYFYADEAISNPFPLTADRVKQILKMNKEGQFPEDIRELAELPEVVEESYGNVVGQDSLTRFDRNTGRKAGNKGRRNKKRNRGPKDQDVNAVNATGPKDKPARKSNTGSRRPSNSAGGADNKTGDNGQRKNRNRSGGRRNRGPRNQGNSGNKSAGNDK